MENDPIVEYIKKNGESSASEIKIAGRTIAAIKTRVAVLYRAGLLTRRSEPMNKKSTRYHWVYDWSGISPKHLTQNDRIFERLKTSALKNEPDYAYHLRNLPRNTDEHRQST